MTEYSSIIELIDKIQLADKYNEKRVVYNDEMITLTKAQRIVDDYTERAGKNGKKVRKYRDQG